MSYEPTEWKNGDVVTAEKLNHIEGGIADAGGGSDADVLILALTQTSATTFTVESSMTEQEMLNFFLEEKEIDGETVYIMRNNLSIVIKEDFLSRQYLPSMVSAFYEDEEFEFSLAWNNVSIGDQNLRAYYINYVNGHFIGDIADYNLVNSGPQ